METKLERMKAEMAAMIVAAHAKGWSPATSTNYSFRLEEQPSVIYVSRSGVDKSAFTSEDFMEVDFDGNPLPNYAGIRPSAETLIHCKLYALFPEMHCIVHSHSVYSVLQSMKCKEHVSLSGYEVLKGFEGIKTHETTIQIPIFDNTQDMPEFCQLLDQNSGLLSIPAFIMRQHGTYAWGRNFSSKTPFETAEYLFEVDWKFKNA